MKHQAALIVIDMQNTFMEPGAMAEVPRAREIVPNINHLALKIQLEIHHHLWWVMKWTKSSPRNQQQFTYSPINLIIGSF